MELLLNLVWVVLAVSTLFAWGRRRNRPHSQSHLIALICLLALLFPVISATDDLHAMRSEMEDSASNKRSLKQVVTGRAIWQQTTHNPPALLTLTFAFLPLGEASSLVVSAPTAGFSTRSRAVRNNRAPPLFELV